MSYLKFTHPGPDDPGAPLFFNNKQFTKPYSCWETSVQNMLTQDSNRINRLHFNR